MFLGNKYIMYFIIDRLANNSTNKIFEIKNKIDDR